MSTFKVGEVGKILRVSTVKNGIGFDLSAEDELTLNFTQPDGTELIKTSADGVTAPAVPVTDADLGALLASEYFEYPTETGFLAAGTAGTWNVCGQYDDPTPKTIIGDETSFVVEDC